MSLSPFPLYDTLEEEVKRDGYRIYDINSELKKLECMYNNSDVEQQKYLSMLIMLIINRYKVSLRGDRVAFELIPLGGIARDGGIEYWIKDIPVPLQQILFYLINKCIT